MATVLGMMVAEEQHPMRVWEKYKLYVLQWHVLTEQEPGCSG
jgi:hypothetical protein